MIGIITSIIDHRCFAVVNIVTVVSGSQMLIMIIFSFDHGFKTIETVFFSCLVHYTNAMKDENVRVGAEKTQQTRPLTASDQTQLKRDADCSLFAVRAGGLLHNLCAPPIHKSRESGTDTGHTQI